MLMRDSGEMNNNYAISFSFWGFSFFYFFPENQEAYRVLAS